MTLKYRKSRKSANCPQRYITAAGYRLGAWQAKTKTNYRQEILPREQIQKLKAIGFDWGKPLGLASRGMTETATYFEENGPANAPRHHVTEDGFKLGDWQARTGYLGRAG